MCSSPRSGSERAHCAANLANTRAAGEPAEAVAPENAIHARIRDRNGVIACQIPDDADWSQAGGLAQIQHLLDDLRSRSVGGVLRSRLAVFEARQAVLPIGSSPAIEAGPTNAKISASLADIPNPVSMLKHPQLVVHIPPEFVHPGHPSCP